MAVDIFGNQVAEITEGRPNLSAVVAGMGFIVTDRTPDDYYLDMVAYALEEDGYCHRTEDIIYYYNNLIETDRDIIFKHMNADDVITDQALKSDDYEQVLVGLYDVPRRIKEIVFCAAIYNSDGTKYNLSSIDGLYFHMFNSENKEVLLKSTYQGYFNQESCIVFGKLYREESSDSDFHPKWRYKGENQGYMGDLGILNGIYCRLDTEERLPEEMSELEDDEEIGEGYGHSGDDLLDPDGSIRNKTFGKEKETRKSAY